MSKTTIVQNYASVPVRSAPLAMVIFRSGTWKNAEITSLRHCTTHLFSVSCVYFTIFEPKNRLPMIRFYRSALAAAIFLSFLLISIRSDAQDLPPRYPMLELFTNTPCPICGSQNPGLFSRLSNYEGEYHLVSFYPGRPYQSCIFYQANTSENTTRLNFYPQVLGTPTVAINGIDFRNSNGVTNTVLDNITGNESWLQVVVDESTGNTRNVTITLEDHVGGSLGAGKLFAVIVERLIMYNAPNGETQHHNVFRKFLTATGGDDVDLSSGSDVKTYQYTLNGSWQADEVYVVAWLMDPETKEIYNSGTRFDPVITAVEDPGANATLDVFPNPAKNFVTISLPEFTEGVVRVFNASGQLIFSDRISRSSVRISTENWTAGVYVAEVEAKGVFIRGRFEVVR